MPVVINEFEVVPEGTPPAQPAAAQDTEREGPAASRDAPELLQLLAAEQFRAERVRAS